MKKFLILFSVILLCSCSESKKSFDKKLKSALERNPTLVSDLFTSHPELMIEALQKASISYKQIAQSKRALSDEKRIEEFLKNPLEVPVNKSEIIKGPIEAPITLVEFVDFQCPFCKKAHSTVEKLMKDNPEKIKLVFKHMPLSFHPEAKLAASYFEAVFKLGPEKIFTFYEKVLNGQNRLRQKKVFLNDVIKELGLDVKKVEKIASSKEVANKIDEDLALAGKLGFEGTPAFVLGGVPISGAYPLEYFEKILLKVERKAL